jgi:SAM-dependent methyltransferase
MGNFLRLSRRYTSKAGWILDNILPPILRESKIFMWPLFRLVLGPQMHRFLSFKDDAWLMTEEEYLERYRLLASAHLERPTDLNESCIRTILASVIGPRVLDIACGRGHLAFRIMKSSPVSVVGIDIAPPEIGSNGRLQFLKGTLEKIPFPDRYFDTVVSAHTLEHVRNLDAAVNELRRVASRRLIIVVPKQREYRYTFDLHLNFFPYEYKLRQALKNEKARIWIEEGDFVYLEDLDPLDNSIRSGSETQ